LEGLHEPEKHLDLAQWSHILTFYDWYWGHLPYNKGARDMLVEPLVEDQARVRLELRLSGGDEVIPVVLYFPSDRQMGWWGSAELRAFFEKYDLGPGAKVKIRRTPSSHVDGVYEIDFAPAKATRVEMLDYDEGHQPVFRRITLRCELDEEWTLTRSRFSALEALRLLDEKEKGAASLLLKTAFQRVGEKLLRGVGIVYRASFTDLLVASNIERPFPATLVQAIFEQDAYPCFYQDEEDYYFYDPGRSDVPVRKVRLTWNESILDPLGWRQ